jgi:hypothetical protein
MSHANVTAVLEPDADADGFGDETQDSCVGMNGPQSGCPAPPAATPQPAAPTTKKKCKRSKKIAPGKKKKCKKKKKK